jgi:hypothetical protein
VAEFMAKTTNPSTHRLWFGADQSAEVGLGKHGHTAGPRPADLPDCWFCVNVEDPRMVRIIEASARQRNASVTVLAQNHSVKGSLEPNSELGVIA